MDWGLTPEDQLVTPLLALDLKTKRPPSKCSSELLWQIALSHQQGRTKPKARHIPRGARARFATMHESCNLPAMLDGLTQILTRSIDHWLADGVKSPYPTRLRIKTKGRPGRKEGSNKTKQ